MGDIFDITLLFWRDNDKHNLIDKNIESIFGCRVGFPIIYPSEIYEGDVLLFKGKKLLINKFVDKALDYDQYYLSIESENLFNTIDFEEKLHNFKYSMDEIIGKLDCPAVVCSFELNPHFLQKVKELKGVTKVLNKFPFFFVNASYFNVKEIKGINTGVIRLDNSYFGVNLQSQDVFAII